jgi:hypothetical protein
MVGDSERGMPAWLTLTSACTEDCLACCVNFRCQQPVGLLGYMHPPISTKLCLFDESPLLLCIRCCALAHAISPGKLTAEICPAKGCKAKMHESQSCRWSPTSLNQHATCPFFMPGSLIRRLGVCVPKSVAANVSSDQHSVRAQQTSCVPY